tara:strand:- start:189 stop:509 length:321 start_codon:yes stop_codon:yes gene_type:complete
MKFRLLTKYKNRKLYCKKESKYMNFDDIVELIRDGWRVGIHSKDQPVSEEEALLEGNKYLVKCFANHIEEYSHSTTSLLANFLYDSWQFEKNIEEDRAWWEGKCIN